MFVYLQVARMMIVVAVGFVISWTPFYVITFISQVQTYSFLRKSNYLFTMLCIHWFGFLNSCVNPIIYNFMNDKFNRSFRQFLTMFTPRLPCCWGHPNRERWSQVTLSPRFHNSYELRHMRDVECVSADASVVLPAFQFRSEQQLSNGQDAQHGCASRSYSSTPPESNNSLSPPRCDCNRFRSRPKSTDQTNLHFRSGSPGRGRRGRVCSDMWVRCDGSGRRHSNRPGNEVIEEGV